MKKVNFTGNFIGIDGEEAVNNDGKVIEISSFVANRLSGIKTDEPIRNVTLAKKIYKDKIVLLEKHDLEFIEKHIKTIGAGDIIVSEILIRLHDAEEIKEKKESKK